MAQLSRVTQKVFGASAGFQQIAQFGSLAAGTPAFTTNLTTVQSLSNYDVGWFNAVLALNSPAIEDMNALFYLITAQIAYGFQSGIPAWDGGTTYYQGSVVSQPVVVFTVTSANATVGATYTNNTVTFTVQATISAGTTLVCTAPNNAGLPTASGTLTKSSGTGDATITYASYLVSTQQYTALTSGNLNQPLSTTAQWFKSSPEVGVANGLMSINSSRTGTLYALLTDQNVDPLANIAGSKISPNFGLTTITGQPVGSNYVATITQSNSGGNRNVLGLITATASTATANFIQGTNTTGTVFQVKQDGGMIQGSNQSIGPTGSGYEVIVNSSQLNVTNDFIVSGSWASGGTISERLRCRSADVLVTGGKLSVPGGSNSGSVTAGALSLAGGNGWISADSTAGTLNMASNGAVGNTQATASFTITALGRPCFRTHDTTAATAPVCVIQASDGQLFRSTSSERYKKDVTLLGLDEAKKILKIDAVNFKSTASADDPDKIFKGFIAERVHEIDPHLAYHAPIREKVRAYTEPADGEEAKEIEIEQDTGETQVDGVDYLKFPVYHHVLIQDLYNVIDMMASRLQALEGKKV